jgi:hypothetical protein
MFGLEYVAMYQYVRITVCGGVSVCSDCGMWRCICMFGLRYVAMYQYIWIKVCGDVLACSDYGMWRCIGMFGLKYVAMYQYALYAVVLDQYMRLQFLVMCQYVRIIC